MMMMHDEDEPMGAPEEEEPSAELQAEALAPGTTDASIQALHRKLAAQGAAAAQPKQGQTFTPEYERQNIPPAPLQEIDEGS